MVQWLGLGTLTAEGPGSIPGWRTKIIQAEQHSHPPKNKNKKKIHKKQVLPVEGLCVGGTDRPYGTKSVLPLGGTRLQRGQTSQVLLHFVSPSDLLLLGIQSLQTGLGDFFFSAISTLCSSPLVWLPFSRHPFTSRLKA